MITAGSLVMAVLFTAWAVREYWRIERDIRRRRQEEWDEHVEHPTVTGYVPPEDRPEWGRK